MRRGAGAAALSACMSKQGICQRQQAWNAEVYPCCCSLARLLQAVPTGDGTAKGRPAALKAWGADHGGGGGSRSRFRDGNVVTSRGEKYIVEKVRGTWKEL